MKNNKSNKSVKSVNGDKLIHVSKLVNPCAYVRTYLAKHFGKVTRSDAVRHFESKGMATYTARTQYQKYFTAQKVAKAAKGRKVAKSRKVAPVTVAAQKVA